MKRSRIQVLIVDDDATQGKALLEAVKRAGYAAEWCNTSVKAITTTQHQEFHCLIVDCMLPKMNGVDLVEEIVQASVNKPKVFLFSGIFKDKKFIKEAIERTGAEKYLVKPFDLADLIQDIDDSFGPSIDADEPPLLALYGERPIEAQELFSLIQSESPVDTIHLPRILRCFSQVHSTGELTLISATGDVSSIHFWEGQIFSVRTPDRESYFGGLAVSFGFVSPEDVVAALKNPSGKLLGQKLIESFSISPHAVSVIMEEQLALRLSQTMQSGPVSLSWMGKKFNKPDFAMNPLRLDTLLSDWAASKLTLEDIQSSLELWGSFKVKGDFHAKIKGDFSIDQLFARKEFSEKTDLLHLFRQLINGGATMGTKLEEAAQDFKPLEHRLDRMIENFKTQNYFQILGIGEKAHSNELNKAFADLKSHYDPKKLPANCPPAVMVKCTKVFQALEKAFEALTDDIQRGQYLVQLQNSRSQKLLEAEPVFHAAIIELQSGHPKDAAKKFQSLIDRKLEFKDLRSYRIWAGLKIDRNYSDLTLEQVPPEERHTAPFFMAKGVYYKKRGHVKKSVEAFRTAYALDPRLSIAKIELQKIKKYLEKTGASRVLLSEVTNVVDTIVGKVRRGA